MTSLLELLGTLEDLGRDAVVHAAPPWTPDSDAACVDGEREESAASGLTYFLEVDLIHDVAEVWSSWRDGRTPTTRELTEAAIHYAEHDAYLPPDEPGADDTGERAVQQ